MKAPDLTQLDRHELLALRCMFECLTVEESVSVLGVQRSRAQYLRAAAMRKIGTCNPVIATRMLCLAGWNNEGKDNGKEEDIGADR